MFGNKWLLIEVVLTLAATGTAMWFANHALRGTAFGRLAAALAGIGLLSGLYLLGLPSAGYILIALLVLLAIAALVGMIGET